MNSPRRTRRFTTAWPALAALLLLPLAAVTHASAPAAPAPAAPAPAAPAPAAPAPPRPEISSLLTPLLPATRDALVAQLCASPTPLTPVQLAPLFLGPPDLPSDIDGARIAVCRRDPALIPFMLHAFFTSADPYRGRFDADVFTRLLRGLQGFSAAELHAALPEFDTDVLVLKSAQALSEWMARLLGRPPRASLGPDGQRAARQVSRVWLARQIDDPDLPLARLLVENGGAASQIDAILFAEHVAAVVEWGDSEEVRAAIEILRQRSVPVDSVVRAAERRLARAPLPELQASLADWIPMVGQWDDRIDDQPVYPAAPPAVPPSDRSWEIPAGRARNVGLPLAASITGLVLLALWLAAVRLLPRRRPFLFRLAALALAPTLLVGLEVALRLAGVAPLAEVRPIFSPNQTHVALYEHRVVEGVPRLVSGPGRHRRANFAPLPYDGIARVVTLGESSVHGDHYLAEDTFSAVLARRLNAVPEPAPVEVINAGIGGAVSDELLLAGLEVLAAQPDVLVLYYGYNDLLHFPMMGEYRGWSSSRLFVRRHFGQSSLVRVLSDLLRRADRPPDPAGAFRDEEEQSPRAARELLRFGMRNARGNMLRLVLAAEEQGVNVVIAAQAVPEHACDWEAPEVAVDGCLSDELLGIARWVAARSDATLVDLQSAVRQRARDGAPTVGGHECFYDGVHPTRLGHAILGEALAPTVRELLRARRSRPP